MGLESARPGIERVVAVREAVGDDVTILIDCHARLDGATAILVAEELAKHRIGWFEEPLEPNDEPEELAKVLSMVSMPVAGGEGGYGEPFFTSLLEGGSLDVIMPDLKYCGGVAEAVAAGRSAVAIGKDDSPHNPFAPISLVASAHASAAVEGAIFLEHAIDEVDWRAEIIEPAENVKNGHLGVANMPGIGCMLNSELMDAKGESFIP